MACPVPLAIVKDDLGIAAADTSQDAWLARRMNGVWARFETYCQRPLQLRATWADDWGKLVGGHNPMVLPPGIAGPPRASTFLRVYPVSTIRSFATAAGGRQDPTLVLFDGKTGELVGIQGQPLDLSAYVLAERVRVEYEAGFPAVPDDLVEALVGCMQVLWQARSAQSSGLAVGGMIPTRIATADVGEVDLLTAPNAFVADAGKGVSAGRDPLIGPWATLLDQYEDLRATLGLMGTAVSERVGGASGGGSWVGETPPLDPLPGASWWHSGVGREFVWSPIDTAGAAFGWVQADVSEAG